MEHNYCINYDLIVLSLAHMVVFKLFIIKFPDMFFVLLFSLTLFFLPSVSHATSNAQTIVEEPFFYSCRVGDIDTVVKHLDSGMSVHTKDARGNSCMVTASGRGQNEIVKLLLARGADPEDATSKGIFEGKSAICWAASQGRVETVALLLQAGADPTTPPSTGVFAGKNALMWAASQGRTDVVRLLINSNVPVDYSSSSGNFKGKTALMWASSQGRVEAVEALLEAGSDVNIVDSDGLSALMWAAGSENAYDKSHTRGLLETAMKGHVKVVELLLSYGALFDQRDKDGITALMFAAFHGHHQAVQTLLNAGADPSFANKAGKTALMLARGAQHEAVVQVIKAGPNYLNLTLEELRVTSPCGLLLHIHRPPDAHPRPPPQSRAQSAAPPPTAARPALCDALYTHDIHRSVYELLCAAHVFGVQSVVDHLGDMTYGARGRAIRLLEALLRKHQDHLL